VLIKKVVLVLAVFFCTNSYGGVYKCADTNGHIVYSKTACNNKSDHQSIVDVPTEQDAPIKLPNATAPITSSSQNNEVTKPSNSGNYKCDGRTRCSQMTSCEEATFFINNCPNTKMDGGRPGEQPDGVPCESQWCN
jgi:hypothetical protein